MSQSKKKRPYAPLCGRSQKEFKQIGNRIMRRTGRVALRIDGEEARFLLYDEAMNLYSMPQDGTRHYQSFGTVSCRSRSIGQPLTSYREWYRWVLAK